MSAHRLLNLALVLALVLTSQTMAVVRGASAATGQMVICIGAVPMTVYVDAEGQPTEAPHLCPEAAMLLVADAALEPAPRTAPVVWTLVPSAAPREVVREELTDCPPARAPPFTV